MKVTIIANFPSRIEGEKEKGRFLYLGEMLSEKGHKVKMLVSDFKHATKERRAFISDQYKTQIVALHEPGYARNVSFKRLWSHYRWGRNVGKYLKENDTPDVVYCAIPSLTAGVKAALFCMKQNIPFIIDVQDLWPEAFTLAIKNKLLQLVFKPIEWYVNRVYKKANAVVAVSDTYARRALAVNAGGGGCLIVYLGNDGALFDASRSIKREIDSEDKLQLAYIGTLSYSYDIKCVIDALAIYNKKRVKPEIHFLVMGDGPLKEEFVRYAYEKGVDVEFTGSLLYADMVRRMTGSDMVVNPIAAGAAQSITNKVGDYALSGLPVISTQENEEYRALVDEYKCGINCKSGNAREVAEALERMATNEDERRQMGAASLKLGYERFDRRFTYKKIVELIENFNKKDV